MNLGETLDDVVIWACPWCHAAGCVLVEVGTQWQIECKRCHTAGPVADKRWNAIRQWNCLAERVALARANHGASH